jgi:hypothetical protein
VSTTPSELALFCARNADIAAEAEREDHAQVWRLFDSLLKRMIASPANHTIQYRSGGSSTIQRDFLAVFKNMCVFQRSDDLNIQPDRSNCGDMMIIYSRRIHRCLPCSQSYYWSWT